MDSVTGYVLALVRYPAPQVLDIDRSWTAERVPAPRADEGRKCRPREKEMEVHVESYLFHFPNVLLVSEDSCTNGCTNSCSTSKEPFTDLGRMYEKRLGIYSAITSSFFLCSRPCRSEVSLVHLTCDPKVRG